MFRFIVCLGSLFLTSGCSLQSVQPDTSPGGGAVSLSDFDWNNPVNLTNHDYWDFDPSFSPDGTKIVFHSNRPPSPGNRGQIYVMNTDGSNPVAMTKTGRTNYNAAWSPDGTKISFSSERDGNTEVYLMNADGTEQVNLTNYPEGYDSGADWSPDGKYLAYFSGMKKPESEEWQPPGSPYRYWNADIYIMNMETGKKTKLTHSDIDDIYPNWSNDGTKLAFVSSRDGNEEIYIINVDGSDERRVTFNDSQDKAPRWLPGDKHLSIGNASNDDESDRLNIQVVNIESGQVTKITDRSDVLYFVGNLSPDNESYIFSAFTVDENAFRGERADIYLVRKK